MQATASHDGETVLLEMSIEDFDLLERMHGKMSRPFVTENLHLTDNDYDRHFEWYSYWNTRLRDMILRL